MSSLGNEYYSKSKEAGVLKSLVGTAAAFAPRPSSTLFCRRHVVSAVFEREWGMLQQVLTTENFTYSPCIHAWTFPLSCRVSAGRVEEYITLFF